MIRRLMDHLPVVIDPERLAGDRATLVGTVACARLPRLSAACPDNQAGSVAVDLAFFLDEARRPRVRGHLMATLEMRCARCLQPLAMDVGAEVDACWVRVGGDVPLPGDIDVMEWQEPLRLDDMIDAEMVLALPMFPRHTGRDCGPAVEDRPPGPLAGLKALVAHGGRDDVPGQVPRAGRRKPSRRK